MQHRRCRRDDDARCEILGEVLSPPRLKLLECRRSDTNWLALLQNLPIAEVDPVTLVL